MPEERVELYTDGVCRGNPGLGGWGVILRFNGTEKSLYGGETETTNNCMELTAAIKGLEALTRSSTVVLTTDSQYVKNGITQWIINWKNKGWLTSAKKPVKNVDLWKHLDELVNKHQVKWEWVRGHTGHAENELADALANRGIDEL